MIDRRSFLLSALAVATVRAQPRTLETFRDWASASREDRATALPPLIEFIRSRDETIQAWVQIKPQRPTGEGLLAEIPFGAKDILETKGLATEYGSPIYKGRIGTEDAAVVRLLRQRGAVLVGKTHSTAFAYRTPGPTRNPRDLAHTPGGSSSGSAAAVAAGMVPLAIGTQTGGSVLRPASFCGVTGFKPTYGLVPMDGVFPFAKSLDTLGFFTHTPADMLAFWEAFGQPAGTDDDVALGVPDPLPEVDPPMAAALHSAVSRVRAAGVAIRSVDIVAMLAKLIEASRTVMFYEGARFHEQRFKEYGDRLADMANLVREGLQIPEARYQDALTFIDGSRRQVAELYKSTPVILVPAAVGPAPLGLTSTGDSRMNAPWTALGTPAISIPMPVGASLPLGLQLTGAHGQDSRVLRTAIKIDAILRRS
jgi:Asp-tRNA(Asn)/Glu-tRNA(Gln) amidotransferase A subunit family amidase